MKRRSLFKRLLGALGLAVAPALPTAKATADNPLFRDVRLMTVVDSKTGRAQLVSYVTDGDQIRIVPDDWTISQSPHLPVSSS